MKFFNLYIAIFLLSMIGCNKNSPEKNVAGILVRMADCGSIAIQTDSAKLFVPENYDVLSDTATFKPGVNVLFSYVNPKDPGLNICMVVFKRITITSISKR